MRNVFLLIGCVVALASCSFAQQPAAATERPNILFIMSDDHAAHAVSAYGSKVNKTPNIDRIAADGMLFRN